RNNVSIAIQYMASWLAGNGCVPINDLMEDAATAEIARAQLWHWIRHRAKLDDGRRIGIELFRELLSQELAKLLVSPPTPQMLPYPEAAVLLDTLSASREIPRFFTEAAYSQLE